MNKKKALKDNPLLDENTALDAFFDGQGVSRATKRIKTPQGANKRPQRVMGKPRSFGNTSLQKITAEIPKDLVMKFNVLVARKSSRLNFELAEAMRLYLK